MGVVQLHPLLFLGMAGLSSSSRSGSNSSRPRVHTLCYSNQIERRMSYALVSAEAHGLFPKVLGLGEKAWWPDGLGAKIVALRRFVLSNDVDPEDLVLTLDILDALVLADRQEILEKFLQIEAQEGGSIIFSAEENCFPASFCVSDYPASTTRWRYLNSGAMVGRVSALRKLLQDEVPAVFPDGDQAWFQLQLMKYVRHEPDSMGVKIMVDTRCRLLCVVLDFGEGTGATFDGDKRITVETGEKPAIVHFPGRAHWPDWIGGRWSSKLHEVFRAIEPEKSHDLLDLWVLRFDQGPTREEFYYKGEGFWIIEGAVVCTRCRLYKRDAVCKHFNSLLDDACFPLMALLFASCIWTGLCGLLCVRPCLLRRSSRASSGTPLKL